MAFSSLEFIFQFLPIFLAAYDLTPAAYRNWTLLFGSLVFYFLGVQNKIWAMLLLAGMLVFVYVAGLLIKASIFPGKAVLVFSLTVLFGCLLGFKYAGVFTGDTPVLPLGISFYTFQMTGYLMDVYRREIMPTRSFFLLSNNFLLFPKILSGPITPYGQLAPQLVRRRTSAGRFDDGLRDFVLGLGLKVLLADRIGGLWAQINMIGYESLSAPLAWLGLIAYSLQLYFDFYAYSVMAVGLGKMLGFQLPENFRHPYAARSMTDFWRKWHITLGMWFRKYIYIPLGGNRGSQWELVRNLLVVWLLTGIWHGSSLNFLLWGLFIFLLVAVEKIWIGEFLNKHKIVSHLYMFFAIVWSWMLFAITDLSQLGIYITRLFAFFDSVSCADFIRYLSQYGVLLAAGIVFSMPGPAKLWEKIRRSPVGTIFLVLVFWACIYCLSVSANDTFMYFSF